MKEIYRVTYSKEYHNVVKEFVSDYKIYSAEEINNQVIKGYLDLNSHNKAVFLYNKLLLKAPILGGGCRLIINTSFDYSGYPNNQMII